MTTFVIATLAAILAFAVAVAVIGVRARDTYRLLLRRVDAELVWIHRLLRETRARMESERRTDEVAGPSPSIEKLLEEIATRGTAVAAFRHVAEETASSLESSRSLPHAKQPAARDALTGVRAPHGYQAELEREVARASRTGRPLTLVVLELDELAETRVRAGHSEADRLLQTFAGLLLEITRITDTVCRRRGEEFAILLPETRAEGAAQLERRLAEKAARTTFGRVSNVTFSAGIAELRSNETSEAFDARARAETTRSIVTSPFAR